MIITDSIIIKTPFIVRSEKWAAMEGEEPIEMRAAYSLDGHYIGDEQAADFLCNQHGIAPEPNNPDSTVCTIGFCEKEQKWYGWSHRAIFGFGIGHVVENGNMPGIFIGRTAETLEDCKEMAVAFAREVG